MALITQDVERNTKQNNLRNNTRKIKQDNANKWCYCYNKVSTDSRCFGICYCFCPAKNIDKDLDNNRCDICPNTFKEYIDSGYFNTENDGLCTILCLPIKIPLFFPCILGTACNNFINCLCKTNRNYLV
jgi:hypothetical protein